MSGIEKEHRLTLALNQVIHSYSTHLAISIYEKKDVLECLKKLDELLREDDDFKHEVDMSEKFLYRIY